ncbi:MAG: DUF4384 domain-containing protein [Pyrinomonadaceae bacterium]
MKIFKIVLPLIIFGAASLIGAAQETPRTANEEFEDYERNFSQVEKAGKNAAKKLPSSKMTQNPPKVLKSIPNVTVKTTSTQKKTNPAAKQSATGSGLPGMKIWFEKQSDCAGAFATVAPTSVFKTGDCVRTRFRLNFDGYLSIVNYGSSGLTKQIFPLDSQNNKILPKTDNFIPDKQGWEFDGEAGDEKLFFIVSKLPLNGDAIREIESRRNSKTESTGELEIYDRDLKPRTEKNEVFVLAGETRLEKPLVFRLTLKHR